MLVSKIITLSLKQLGVLAVSENASADEIADALDSLNGLLAQWATHKLYIYKAATVELLLNGATHRVNTAGILSEKAWLDGDEVTLMRDTNETARYSAVTYQKIESGFEITVHDSDARTLKIKTLTLPHDLLETDDLDFPAHYQRPLILSLALEIAPMFGVEPTVLLLKNQANALEFLKRSNVTPLYANNDLPVGIGYGCR